MASLCTRRSLTSDLTILSWLVWARSLFGLDGSHSMVSDNSRPPKVNWIVADLDQVHQPQISVSAVSTLLSTQTSQLVGVVLLGQHLTTLSTASSAFSVSAPVSSQDSLESPQQQDSVRHPLFTFSGLG